MIFRYLFANRLTNPLTNLRSNLCRRCLSTLVSTEEQDRPPVIIKKYNKTKDHYLCIKDPNIAKLVAKYVTSHITEDTVIFESCPGTGLLTKELLESDVKSVRVFEDNAIYLKGLNKLQKQYPNRLQIIDKQILNFRKFLSNHLNEYEYEVEYWFQNISVKEWSSPPSLKFVAVLSHKNTLFLRFIMKILLRKDMFFSFGRTEFFVFVSESEHQYITAKPRINYSLYRSTTVLYNTLFDIQTLETIPYKNFEVYTKEKNLSKKQLERIKGNAKLIQLTPKEYLQELNAQTLQDYYFFVNQTFMKRKNYVIPFLENWFPNCGPDLIKKGMPVFKYFGDLRPEEVLDLFKYFYNRSDYKNTLYKMFAMREDFEGVEESLKEDDIEDNDDHKDITDKNTTEESLI